jgi:hypothetical protein
LTAEQADRRTGIETVEDIRKKMFEGGIPGRETAENAENFNDLYDKLQRVVTGTDTRTPRNIEAAARAADELEFRMGWANRTMREPGLTRIDDANGSILRGPKSTGPGGAEIRTVTEAKGAAGEIQAARFAWGRTLKNVRDGDWGSADANLRIGYNRSHNGFRKARDSSFQMRKGVPSRSRPTVDDRIRITGVPFEGVGER